MCYILNKHETFENWGRTFCFVCNPNDFIAGQLYETCIRHQNSDFTLILRAVGHIIEYGIYTFDLANPANDFLVFAFPSACTQSVDVVECRRSSDDVYSTNFEWLIHCLQCADSACSVESIHSCGFTSFHPHYWNLQSSEISRFFGVHAIMKDERTDLQTRFDWLLSNYERLASSSTGEEQASDSKVSYAQLESQLERLTHEFKQYTHDSTAQLQKTCEEHVREMRQLRDDNARLKDVAAEDMQQLREDNVQLKHELLQLQDRPAPVGDDAAMFALKAQHATQVQQLQDDLARLQHAHQEEMSGEKAKMQQELDRCQSEFRLYTKESSIHLSELERTNQTLQQKLQETMRTSEKNEVALRETKRMLEVQANSTTSMTAHRALLDENQALARKCVDHDEIQRRLRESEHKVAELQAENDAHRELRLEARNAHAEAPCDLTETVRALEESLRVERDAHAQTRAQYQKQNKEARAEVSALQIELRAAHADVIRTPQTTDRATNLEAALRTERHAHAETSSAMQAQTRELITTQQALAQSQTQHEETRAEVSALQSALQSALRAAHDDHADVIRTLQTDLVGSLEAALQTEREAHTETSSAMQVQTRELITTRQALAQSQKQCEEARAEVSALQSELRAAHDDHADVIRTLQTDLVGGLETALQTERDAHAETSSAMQAQSRDVVATRQALAQSQKQHEEARAELSAMQRALRDSHDDHADVIRTLQTDLVGQLEASLQAERNAVQNATRDLATARQECTMSQLQHERTRSELNAVQNELRLCIQARDACSLRGVRYLGGTGGTGGGTGGGASNSSGPMGVTGGASNSGGPTGGTGGTGGASNSGWPTGPPAPTKPIIPPSPTIVERALSTPELSTLVSLVKMADLVTTLSGTGPFTVFAPTNAAFNALSPARRASLLAPENRTQLVRVLRNHVVSGVARSTDLATMRRIRTLQGHDLSIASGCSKETFVANARVVMADLPCANGVVHVVDRVIDLTKHTPHERPPPIAAFPDKWEHPPLSTLGAVDDEMSTFFALGDPRTLHRLIDRVVWMLRNSTNVTHMAVLLTLYLVLRR